MAELPDEIWGVIAAKLVERSNLAPVSRKFYAITVRAIKNAVESVTYRVDPPQLVCDFGSVRVGVRRQNTVFPYWDAEVLSHGGRFAFDFDRASLVLQARSGTLKVVRGVKVGASPLSPLTLNYILSDMINTIPLHFYPQWIEKYRATVVKTAERFREN